jgi:hypothetical protein
VLFMAAIVSSVIWSNTLTLALTVCSGLPQPRSRTAIAAVIWARAERDSYQAELTAQRDRHQAELNAERVRYKAELSEERVRHGAERDALIAEARRPRPVDSELTHVEVPLTPFGRTEAPADVHVGPAERCF